MKKFFNHSVKMALAISAVVLVSQQGFARSSSGDGVLLSLNPMYSTSSNNQTTEGTITTTPTETNSTLIDINLGYQMGNGLYLGLLYMTDSIETKNGGVTTKTTASGYGPSVGYMKNGWFGHFHYILSAEGDPDTSTTAKWSKGTGTQFDIGYMMPVAGPFALGVELAYRTVEFGTYTDNSGTASTANKWKLTDINPKIRFTFIF